MRTVKVTDELPTGRNVEFADMDAKRYMSLGEFIARIKKGEYPDYYIKVVNGEEIPVSKPNGIVEDNLG